MGVIEGSRGEVEMEERTGVERGGMGEKKKRGRIGVGSGGVGVGVRAECEVNGRSERLTPY